MKCLCPSLQSWPNVVSVRRTIIYSEEVNRPHELEMVDINVDNHGNSKADVEIILAPIEENTEFNEVDV